MKREFIYRYLCVPGAAKDAGIQGELVHEGSRLWLDVGGLHANPFTGWHEECAIYQYVPICSPVPARPIAFIRILTLRHLLCCVLRQINSLV